MAAKKRTLKGVVKTIESLERSCKEYYEVKNFDMVKFYQQKLRDVKYLKRLVEKDMKKIKIKKINLKITLDKCDK